MRISLALITTAFILSSCGSSDNNSKTQNSPVQESAVVDSAIVGLWVDKSQAEELAKTGKLESLCARMKEEPLIGKPSDTRFIETNGSVSIYVPDGILVPMGTVDKSGRFNLADAFKQQNVDAQLSMKVSGDILIVITTYSNTSGTVDVKSEYVRTNIEDIKNYFNAIEACPRQ